MTPLTDTHHTVQAAYARIARTGGGACCGPACCSPAAATDPSRLGYTVEDEAAAPEGANLGLGCGNPQAIAALRPGERVLDLGSGAGFDCFLAAQAVGPQGTVIGVDMTPEIIVRARANARAAGLGNVVFRKGLIEALPVEDGTIDVILSNCVVNLSPDKAQVFREAFRVLAPGGRLAIADVLARQPIAPEHQADLALVVGCIGGAATVAEVEGWLQAAGFVDIEIAEKPGSREIIEAWAPGHPAVEQVMSATLAARKP